jgi:rhamnose transport system substrate-binding protein
MSTLATPPPVPSTGTVPPAAEMRTAPRIAAPRLIVAALLLTELGIFSVISQRFLTTDNFLELLRLIVELGLLALALTPVIVTGGIDLSVGSLLGLCAVLFGKLCRDAGVAPLVAAGLTLAIGAAAGGLNAALITRLRIPALIVTLGSFSLFRGLAEAITQGVDNFAAPRQILFLGQGYVGPVPVQVLIFIVAALGFWALLHRLTIGRALSAIGYSPEGARYAGIPVNRRIALTYVLSGLASSLAAVIYVAHWGQAKADAGTGYELDAIAAVVLGGTSIFGGRGSIVGTLMGLLAIAILKRGLGLAALPTELASILTGVLLLVAIGLEWQAPARKATPARDTVPSDQELNMRNAQLAVLSVVILLAALIVAGGNYFLVRSIQKDVNQGHAAPSSGAGVASGGHTVTIAMMPKSKGNAYFIACRQGAEEAAKERGIQLIWDGPTDPDPAKQNEFIETWITRGVDVIAVAVENRGGISGVLRKARQKGIKVVTWDSDAEPDARDFFVNQATPQGIGSTLMDTAAKVMGDKGDFAIITASLTAANMNEWQKYIEQDRAANHPQCKMVALRPCDDLQPKAFDEAKTIMNAYPSVKLIMAICSPAVPGAAEAVKQSGRSDVKVIGLGLPNDNKQYVHDGITSAVVLWKTMDLGYLTVIASEDLMIGHLKTGDKSLMAGRLGNIQIDGDNLLLGKPFVFTNENIDKFNF